MLGIEPRAVYVKSKVRILLLSYTFKSKNTVFLSFHSHKYGHIELGVVAHTCNTSPWKVNAERLLCV